MGQYYMPLLFKKGSKKVLTVESWDYDCGSKLTEHSYLYRQGEIIGSNDFMDKVASIIYNKIYRVAWIGDYSKDDENGNDFQKSKDFNEYYRKVWGTDSNTLKKDPDIEFDWSGKYLWNFTKECYISFDKYVGLMVQYRKDNNFPSDRNNEGLILNPLSLLTACGNGLGGGDYEGINMEMVGAWAGDELSIEDSPLCCFRDKTEECLFEETWIYKRR